MGLNYERDKRIAQDLPANWALVVGVVVNFDAVQAKAMFATGLHRHTQKVEANRALVVFDARR